MFIKLTECGMREPIYYNINIIETFYRFENRTVMVSIIDHNHLEVKETPEEILTMIKEKEK